jgi:eukaryotic-like serine/threonine-protein kinase
MELVEGPTLDDLIRHSRLAVSTGLPLDQVLSIARQIANALEAAHEAGIVHRDLKPANVKVRDDGVVKVLDFGLAKIATGAGGPGSDPSGELASIDSPTITSPAMTEAGIIIGTAAYMSPEQARGRAVDKRADIWAFGVLLFEMLTGRPLFAGETVSDTIAAVLMREPEFASLPAAVPPQIRTLISRCLERDPKHRLRDIGDALHELQPLSAASVGPRTESGPQSQSSLPTIPLPQRRNRWLAAWVGVVLVVALIGLWQVRQRTSTGKPSISPDTSARSIAVLPFINQSGNPDDEYFSDGMTDELATALMKTTGLRVAARSSSFTFKGKNADAREVGTKLDVATVLEGTVRRSGSKVRVTAELVDTADGLVRWSERYEREANEVFEVQDDITAAIVTALKLTMDSNSLTAKKADRTDNAEAHDLYLRGRFLVINGTEEAMRNGLDYLTEALKKDPGYAPAYATTALAYTSLADAYSAPREAYPKARTAALKALELDSTNADAHTNMGLVQFYYDWKFEAANVELRRAVELNPNSMEAHNFYGECLCAMGRWNEGLAEVDRAIVLDPLSPAPSRSREQCLLSARKYDETIAQHTKTSELDASFFYYDSFAGAAYREKGMFAESLAEYQRLQRVTGGQLFAGLAITYARMGKTAEARGILKEFLEFSKRKYVSPDKIALIYASLGEKDEAFVWLDRAYENRSGFLPAFVVTPDYDPLRSDPRFDVLMRKMGLKK